MIGPEIIVRCQCGNRARVNGRCRRCHAEWEQLNPRQAAMRTVDE